MRSQVTDRTLQAELERYLSLSLDDKRAWLTRLIFGLTIEARSTYEVGGTSLDDPARLRSFNELIHRCAGQLRETYLSKPGRPDDVFLKILSTAISELKMDQSHLTTLLLRKS